jgi:hypothetical protein
MHDAEKKEYFSSLEAIVDNEIYDQLSMHSKLAGEDKPPVPKEHDLYESLRVRTPDEVEGVMKEAGLRTNVGRNLVRDLMSVYTGYRTGLNDLDDVRAQEEVVKDTWPKATATMLIEGVKEGVEEAIDNHAAQKGRSRPLKERLPRGAIAMQDRKNIARKLLEVLHSKANVEELLDAAGVPPKGTNIWRREGRVDPEFSDPDMQRTILTHQAEIQMRYMVGAAQKRDVFEMQDFVKENYRDKADAIINTAEKQVDAAIEKVLGKGRGAVRGG